MKLSDFSAGFKRSRGFLIATIRLSFVAFFFRCLVITSLSQLATICLLMLGFSFVPVTFSARFPCSSLFHFGFSGRPRAAIDWQLAAFVWTVFIGEYVCFYFPGCSSVLPASKAYVQLSWQEDATVFQIMSRSRPCVIFSLHFGPSHGLLSFESTP